MVSAVVFDVGNVLYHWDPGALYADLIQDETERAWFLNHVVTPDWHFQHDAGRPFADTSAERIAEFPRYRDLIECWGPRFDDTITGPVEHMIELIEALDAADVPLFAITNFSAEFWAPFRHKRASVFDRFRDIVVSGEEKIMKPDPAIYRLALARFGLRAGEALFIDDRHDNVLAADANRFVGHHFTDYANLAPILRAFNLPAPQSS
jgi:2-haloacid dehalogenase